MTENKRQALRRQKAPRRVVQLLTGAPASGVTSTDETLLGPSAPLKARIYRPGDTTAAGLPVVVAFHGGGWMFGNLETAEWLWSELAARVPAFVVAGTYRLPPEHPAPAALVDAFALTSRTAAHVAEPGGMAEGVAVVGESSGATLAASGLLARDLRTPSISCQALIHPITDLTLSPPSVGASPAEPILSADDLRSYVKAYLGRRGQSHGFSASRGCAVARPALRVGRGSACEALGVVPDARWCGTTPRVSTLRVIDPSTPAGGTR